MRGEKDGKGDEGEKEEGGMGKEMRERGRKGGKGDEGERKEEGERTRRKVTTENSKISLLSA